MKVTLMLAVAFIAAATVFGSKSLAQEAKIAKSQLPRAAQQFLSRYFPAQEAGRIIKDKELMKTEYEVYLANAVKIEFDGNGNWKEIDGKKQPIPTAFIPPAITRYVSGNFPARQITKIEKTNSKYEVELSNGTDLDFNLKGAFLRIDD